MIELLKTRNVQNPERNFGDAGIDFFVPNNDKRFIDDFNKVNPLKENIDYESTSFDVQPGDSVLIPSGIHSNINPDYVLIFLNKSGIALKQKLVVGAQVVDASYQGEIFIHLNNFSNNTTTINFGQKIVQGLVIKHYPNDFIIEDFSENKDLEKDLKNYYKEHKFERGCGAFGSTGI